MKDRTKPTDPRAHWDNPSRKAESIGAVSPFIDWPAEPLGRLAQAAQVVTRPAGAALLSRGEEIEAAWIVLSGNVCVSLRDSGGRVVSFVVARPMAGVFGIAPMIDSQAAANDVTADQDVVALQLPLEAIRRELALQPVLWATLAREASARARYAVDQLFIHLFEPLRTRAARLLLGLAASSGSFDENGCCDISIHMPQERLAHMLGVSRQTATALVRELSELGVIQWRYGRVRLTDMPRLRELAA